MTYVVLNAAPILLAAVAGLLVLLAAAGKRLSWGRAAGALLGLSWLSAILAGALILAPVTAGAWTIAFGSAFIIWAGFVLPALTIGLVLRGARVVTSLGDALVWLAIMLVMAAALNAFGLVRPT